MYWPDGRLRVYRYINTYIYIHGRCCKVCRNTNLMCFPSRNTIRYEICPQCIRKRQQDLYDRSAFHLDKFTLFDILVIKYVGICAPLVLKDNSNRYKKESLFIGFNICKKHQSLSSKMASSLYKKHWLSFVNIIDT